MHLLPQDVDSTTYWQDIYKRPLDFWQPALAQIAERHALPAGAWNRATLGRNIVFLAPTYVVKLGRPDWHGEMAREAAALQFIAGKLPVATPDFIATATLDGWEYLVQTRLPGENLRGLWQQLDDANKLRLVHQHGELMAAIHRLPLDNAPASLNFDWETMLAEQHEVCASDMAANGVDAALLAQVEPYLALTPWHMEQGERALLHGDVNFLNFLVAERAGSWTITGLIDWGDVKIGPSSHEFISPAICMYVGDRALLWQMYQGYQTQHAQRLWESEQIANFEHIVMARSMLYYPDTFGDLLQKLPAAPSHTTWEAIAATYLQMTSYMGGPHSCS